MDGGNEQKEGGSEAERAKEGKEEGSEAGRRVRKRGPALRTKLKCRGCNSGDLKTISGTLFIEEHR